MTSFRPSRIATPPAAAPALVIACVSLVSWALPFPLTAFALSPSAPVWHRLVFHFVSGNVFHALACVWCLALLVFYYRVPLRHLLAAYAIACLCPLALTGGRPVVGLSALCFALIGLTTVRVIRKRLWLGYSFAIVCLGFFLPSIAAAVHLYALVTGLVLGYFLKSLHSFFNFRL